MSRYLESPPVRWLIDAGDISAGGSWTPGTFEGTENEKFMPFNVLTISNLSGQLMDLDYGQDRRKLIPPGTIQVVERGGITGFTIYNLDASLANDKRIEIVLERVATERHIALAQYLKVPLCRVIDGNVGGF